MCIAYFSHILYRCAIDSNGKFTGVNQLSGNEINRTRISWLHQSNRKLAVAADRSFRVVARKMIVMSAILTTAGDAGAKYSRCDDEKLTWKLNAFEHRDGLEFLHSIVVYTPAAAMPKKKTNNF